MQYGSMKIEILKKVENQVFNRTKIFFSAEHGSKEATPSRKQVRDVLTAKLGANKELIVIESVKSHRGKNISRGAAFLYSDKASLDKIAKKHLTKRDAKEPKVTKKEEPAPVAEAPVEEKAEAKPTEDATKEANEGKSIEAEKKE